jgi:ubiquinone/menaquinone biosynthesis C-methylase UbiE
VGWNNAQPQPLVLIGASSTTKQQSPFWAPTTEQIFEAVGVSEGLTVCEIGAGNGELTVAAARVVGPKGKIFSSELGATSIRALQIQVKSSGLEQIVVVEGDPKRTNFPDNSCDAVLMRFVWHHLDDRVAMSSSVAQSLKPGGRVAIVEGVTTEPTEADRGPRSALIAQDFKAVGLEAVVPDVWGPRWFMVV